VVLEKDGEDQLGVKLSRIQKILTSNLDRNTNNLVPFHCYFQTFKVNATVTAQATHQNNL
jgi:hypothetical protein